MSARSRSGGATSDSTARSRCSEKKIRPIVEFFELVLTIWRTNSDTIADPAGRHIACSQFQGCKVVRSPQDRRFHLSVASFPRCNLRREDQIWSLEGTLPGYARRTSAKRARASSRCFWGDRRSHLYANSFILYRCRISPRN